MKTDATDKVYVVALGSSTPPWSKMSWRDIVNVRRRYMHPVGGPNWPKEPVEWLGFRYAGRLQTVHRVESVATIACRTELSQHVPEIDGEECRRHFDHGAKVPHFVYTLGPPIYPDHIVRSGKVFGPGHLWVDRDLLLSSRSVSEAFEGTKDRGSSEKPD